MNINPFDQDHSMHPQMSITTSPSSPASATPVPLPCGAGAPGTNSQSPFAGGITSPGFVWAVTFLEKRGKEKFGEKFRIYPQDHNLIFKLLIYFLRLESEASQLGLDLTKGILLTGPIGCGKTKLITLMKLVALPNQNFIMKPCREVTFEFIRDGFEVIHRYSHMSYNNQHPKIYCFDDLGAEQTLKHYGNECNVIGEILLSRYDHYVNSNMITHITTNLSPTKIEEMYGNRVRSRLREMHNLISFTSTDKRS